MSAAVELVRGPTGAGKTETLLRLYHAQPPGTALWIAPTDRARAAIHPRLVRDEATPTNLATLPEVARRIVVAADANATLAPELHQQLLLDDVIAGLVRGRKLRHFGDIASAPGFARAVFDLLTELKGRGVSPTALAETCGEVFKKRPKDTELALLYATYQKRLLDLHILDREAVYLQATQIVARGAMGPWRDVQVVLVDGFVEFTKPQFDALAAIAQRVERIVISLVADPADDERRAETFARTGDTEAKIAERFGSAVSFQELQPHAAARPAGLDHLARQLFQPLGEQAKSRDASGIALIEAPGQLGEVRMVARAVRTLLDDGSIPDRILIVARNLNEYVYLLHEVLAEYGVPADIEGSMPLIRRASVATLLRALRLPADEFPFAGTTALLRSTYLQPDWPEFQADPTIALRSDALLRGLGVARGRDAYLRSVANWSAAPAPLLEDEEAEGPHRLNMHRVAGTCRPFLYRFFSTWDRLPKSDTLASWIKALRDFADDLGLSRVAADTPGDSEAFERLFAELDEWAGRESGICSGSKHSPASFIDCATRIATAIALPLTGSDVGMVRIVSAEQARALECDHMFLIGLGEGKFPLPTSSGPFYSQNERHELRAAGLDVRVGPERIPDEKLLFLQLASKPRRLLTLSYPATDERGQELLPSTFLEELKLCFTPGAISTTKHTMLLGGFGKEKPLSAAEQRVHWAMSGAKDQAPLSGDLFEHLRRTEVLAKLRFETKDVTPCDGGLTDRGIVEKLAERFGPNAVLSPTALERYIACPFKFFVGDVLGLEALEEPGEFIEAVDRGAVVHRALARVHRNRKTASRLGPDAALASELTLAIDDCVREEADRAAGPAAKVLWKLEGRRLHRMADRYARHWTDVVAKWGKDGFAPLPAEFELAFGMPGAAQPPLVITVVGETLRIRGRIDRVDVAKLPDGKQGFLILDYKTGSSGISASEIASMQRLQLPLYSMAVEQMLPGAGPLGMAYWFLSQNQNLRTFPARKLWGDDLDSWPKFRDRLGEWIAALAKAMRSGDFALRPRSTKCTETCDFGQVCRIAQSRNRLKSGGLELPEAPADE